MLAGGVEGLNGLGAEEAREVLLGCCASGRWAAEVAGGRPYGLVEEVLARSDRAVAGLTEADLAEALAGHPRIGERPPAGPGGADGPDRSEGGGGSLSREWARGEQAGVQEANQVTIKALAAGNRAYEQRFGHIYLVCATGRSGAELLALLRERLEHDPATEWHIVRRELGKINQIRLRKLLEGAG